MMASMKPAKHSVAVVVRNADGEFLVVRRPADASDPLAGLWGLPAITLRDGEDERGAVVRAGRVKLGVDLAAGRKLGEVAADRGSYVLRLADYEATIVTGTPRVPQAGASMTQYVAAMFTDDPTVLDEAAAKGSLCARIFLEANASAERDRAADFRRRTGLDRLVDVHTHFMPSQLLAAVWAYFDAAGPLTGRSWPIRYREQEQRRIEVLRAFGVRAFTSMLYPHKPGMARSLNDWAASFAARTPDCLHTATFFAEPAAAADVRRALSAGARVFKCHLQVGGFDPNDPLLDDAWGLLAEAGVPVVTHCGSAPVPGAHTGPGPIGALLARHPRLRLVVAHLGMPEYAEFLALAERHDRVLLDTTMAFTSFAEAIGPFPRAELPRLEALGDRVLLGTDYPNIPYAYPDALEALERAGFSAAWLRAVCHDNAAVLFALLRLTLRCVFSLAGNPGAEGDSEMELSTFMLATSHGREIRGVGLLSGSHAVLRSDLGPGPEMRGALRMVVTELFSQRAERRVRSDWRTSAACRTVDPELFFPVSSIGPARDDIAKAKAVCGACQVRRQCLQFALATQQLYGVWGGTTEEERRIKVREQRGRERGQERAGAGRSA